MPLYPTVSTVTLGSTAVSRLCVGSNTIWPVTTPLAAKNLTAVNVLRAVTLGWTLPDNGGSPLTKQTIQASMNGGAFGGWGGGTLGTTDTSVVYTAVLQASTTYVFRHQANNILGGGAYAEFPSFTTLAAPDQPASVTMARAGTRTVNVSWPNVADPVGAPITKYQISWGTATNGTGVGSSTVTLPNASITQNATTTTFKTPTLTLGQVLYFRVSAINDMATGVGRVSTTTFTVVN